MIGKLQGILDSIYDEYILINVNGVFYQVVVPLTTLEKLPMEGEELSLYTSLYVREDMLTLYGFLSIIEKDFYEMLISASGVGPKLALKIMGSISIDSFCDAIVNRNIALLTRINGLGKKSAEKMVIELKDRVKRLAIKCDRYDKGKGDVKIVGKRAEYMEESILALVQLGFKYDSVRRVVREVISELDEENCSSENIIRISLQRMTD